VIGNVFTSSAKGACVVRLLRRRVCVESVAGQRTQRTAFGSRPEVLQARCTDVRVSSLVGIPRIDFHEGTKQSQSEQSRSTSTALSQDGYRSSRTAPHALSSTGPTTRSTPNASVKHSKMPKGTSVSLMVLQPCYPRFEIETSPFTSPCLRVRMSRESRVPRLWRAGNYAQAYTW